MNHPDIEHGAETKVTAPASSSKMEKDDDEVCPCGDPSSHKFECALFCGQHPCWDELIKLPKCNHYLHEACLEQLLFTRMSKCPLCRSSVDQWRRSKHYHRIEEEISKAFSTDTELALELSKKMYEEEQRKKKALANSNDTATDSSRSERSRERDRDRDRNRNHNHSRSEESSVDLDRRRDRDRGDRERPRGRFRSFFTRARSRSRSRHRRTWSHSR